MPNCHMCGLDKKPIAHTALNYIDICKSCNNNILTIYLYLFDIKLMCPHCDGDIDVKCKYCHPSSVLRRVKSSANLF